MQGGVFRHSTVATSARANSAPTPHHYKFFQVLRPISRHHNPSCSCPSYTIHHSRTTISTLPHLQWRQAQHFRWLQRSGNLGRRFGRPRPSNSNSLLPVSDSRRTRRLLWMEHQFSRPQPHPKTRRRRSLPSRNRNVRKRGCNIMLDLGLRALHPAYKGIPPYLVGCIGTSH